MKAHPGVRIGTSGFSYRHWVDVLYPKGTPQRLWLETYAGIFNTVEINYSFYRLPNESTLAGWAKRTPPDFLFALKGSRYITHRLRLKDSHNAANLFLDRAMILGKKLGPVLFQLPPGMKSDPGLLDSFLERLPPGMRYALEFRHSSWLTDEIYEILRKKNAALCLHDLCGFECEPLLTADWAYIRFHGPTGRYTGRYNDSAMKGWAERIRSWKSEGADVFAYFNNDIGGHAVMDSLELKKFLGEPGGKA